MQRRNVLLPDPDGPIRHSTSLGATSRSIPRSTSSRPNRLCTASAFTMGSDVMPIAYPVAMLAPRRRSRRPRMEGEQRAAKSWERRRRQLALRASREVPLDVVLAESQDRGHHQIPGADDEQELDDGEVGAGDLFSSREQLDDG